MRLRTTALMLLLAALLAVLIGCESKPPSETASNSDNASTSSSTNSSSGGLFSRSSTVTIPEGTSIVVRLDQALSSKSSTAGESFTATVAQPISVGEKV